MSLRYLTVFFMNFLNKLLLLQNDTIIIEKVTKCKHDEDIMDIQRWTSDKHAACPSNVMESAEMTQQFVD